MTHLADVADRIDRSYSPRGGREERDLDFLFCSSKTHAASSHMQTYTQANMRAVALISCTENIIRCSPEIATMIVHKRACYHSFLPGPHLK